MLNKTFLESEDAIFVVVCNDKRYKGVCEVSFIPRDIIKKLRNIEHKDETMNVVTSVVDTFAEYVEELTATVEFLYTLVLDFGARVVPAFISRRLENLEKIAWDKGVDESIIEKLFYDERLEIISRL